MQRERFRGAEVIQQDLPLRMIKGIRDNAARQNDPGNKNLNAFVDGILCGLRSHLRPARIYSPHDKEGCAQTADWSERNPHTNPILLGASAATLFANPIRSSIEACRMPLLNSMGINT